MSAPAMLPPPGDREDINSAPTANIVPSVTQPLGPLNGGRRPPPPPLDTMRAYRACLNCRNRKSKCDLEQNQGRPPCRRCTRENRECVLGESHRGGRRVRKKPKLEDDHGHVPEPPIASGYNASTGSSSHYNSAQPSNPSFHHPYDNPQEASYSWQISPIQPGLNTKSLPRNPDNTSLSDPEFRSRNESIISAAGKQVQEAMASTDLQHPSDALNLLAQVADQAEDDSSASDKTPQSTRVSEFTARPDPLHSIMETQWHYQPAQDGLISPQMIYTLFSSYHACFHPYVPIIPKETFEPNRLPWLSRHEPHLFSAILLIASKDTESVYQICYDHMQQLISKILTGADAGVEAVEALLLLSQWVPLPPRSQASTAVGRGEEDRIAWMHVGTALRLAYFLGIDQTSFKSSIQENNAEFNRKRLVWSACYAFDRQVSVRVGKGFWARGPGPLSGSKSTDFPTLQPAGPGAEDYAFSWSAGLGLVQIFSNVYDILYSTKDHGWKAMLEGRYAKYLDDFRASIRRWYDEWATIVDNPGVSTGPKLGAIFLLTYDYLRLYVNAFAYQATISRAITLQKEWQYGQNRPMPRIDAAAPDARFIYDAIDAAKSILSTFNNTISLEVLRYMPSVYYIFAVYSAVFLYKARSTTTMSNEERVSIRALIKHTIEKFQKASTGANHIGSRYARLLQLLWRKSPKRSTTRTATGQPATSAAFPLDPALAAVKPSAPGFPQDPNRIGYSNAIPLNPSMSMNGNGGQGFSWLDLSATWNFATQNGNHMSSSSGSDDNIGISGSVEMDPFDGYYGEYGLLEGEGGSLIF